MFKYKYFYKPNINRYLRNTPPSMAEYFDEFIYSTYQHCCGFKNKSWEYLLRDLASPFRNVPLLGRGLFVFRSPEGKKTI